MPEQSTNTSAEPYLGRHRNRPAGPATRPAVRRPVMRRPALLPVRRSALTDRLPTLAHAARRPVVSAAVAVGVLAATAAGYANTTPQVAQGRVGSADSALSAAAAGPSELEIRTIEYDDKVQSARMKHEALALLAARKAAAAKAAALAKARKDAADRAARAAARKSILARAQSNPRSVGRLLAAELYGWTGSQFSCLDSLWTKESNWKYRADNPTSSAYGIPQALPGSRMASAGSDWATNPATQIKWGLNYIEDRYGSPCSAWAHSRAVNWY